MIELVLAIVVLGILSVFTMSFVGNAIKSYSLVKEQEILYSDGTYVMERIVRELSDAVSISSPSSESSSSTLTFTTPAHPGRPSATVVFAQSGRNLLRNNVLIGQNIKTFNTTRNLLSGALDETITVQLELDSLNDPSIPSLSIITRITPNNYGTNQYTGRSFNGHYYETIQ